MKKLLKFTGIALLLLIGGVLGFIWLGSAPLPTGHSPEKADILAKRMLSAVNDSAWQKTGAVSWVFKGEHRHLWDRKRHYAKVAWNDYEVYMDLSSRQGVATQQNRTLQGEEASKALAKAWALWCNDSFWLNPVSKIFDEGTKRRLVTLKDGQTALLVAYNSGGVTPGDAYLWEIGDNGRPVAWQLWVSIIPLKGIRFSWDNWTQTSTGAWISQNHSFGPIEVNVGAVKTASSLTELTAGADPFAGMIAAMQ